jgi:hypothetical protein
MQRDDNWASYGDERISSIYSTVYNKFFALPAIQGLKDEIIKKMEGTTIVSMTPVILDSYYGNWIPSVKFHLAIPGKKDLHETHSVSTESKLAISIGLDDYLPSGTFILECFAQNVGDGHEYPIHMHGLMTMHSAKNGTKGGKNRLVPWIVNKLMRSPEITEAKTRTEERLAQSAYTSIVDPEYHAEYIQARDKVGKMGIIKQLKGLRHLPIEVIKEALNEFLCTDVMDDFEEK